MLVWVNGAFGAGKTQVAYELARRLPGGHVADPEVLGFALQRMLPPGACADFQDLPQWRSGVLDTLTQAARVADGPVLVPMTLVRVDYLDQVVGGLVERGIDVCHIALQATPETLVHRLHGRLTAVTGLRRETWALQQIPRCVAALADDRFATHVPTDGRGLDEVVEEVAEHAGLPLVRPRQAPGLAALRRLRVGLAHLR